MTDVQQAVKSGIEWMDERFPGWYRKVDTVRLNQHDGSRCVLSQVAGMEYANAVRKYLDADFHVRPVQLGLNFMGVNSMADRALSTTLWRAEVERRRAADIAETLVLSDREIKLVLKDREARRVRKLEKLRAKVYRLQDQMTELSAHGAS